MRILFLGDVVGILSPNTPYYAAVVLARLFALAVLVGSAGAVYFGVAYAIGAVDRERLALLRRRHAAEPASPSE